MALRSLVRAGLALMAALAARGGRPRTRRGSRTATRCGSGRATSASSASTRPRRGSCCARADGTPWACGRAAADRLAELVAEGPVRCRPEDRDRYGRLVSTCTAGGVDLGGRLVAEGLARAYARYSDAYVAARGRSPRRRARPLAGRGGRPLGLPRRHRAAPRRPPAPRRRRGCAIKGNVSAGGARIYHLPGAPGYARTRIDAGRGEAWFCDEAAARAAGFRRPRGP